MVNAPRQVVAWKTGEAFLDGLDISIFFLSYHFSYTSFFVLFTKIYKLRYNARFQLLT